MDNKDETLLSSDFESAALTNELIASKKSKFTSQSKNYKTMKCKVISYNKDKNYLDVNFNGYGIRVKDVKNFDIESNNFVDIQYKGEIGKPNFEYKLQVIT